MKGKSTFTHKEINEIKYLLDLRSDASRDEQKSLRDKLRKIGFYISDYKKGLTSEDVDQLINLGAIKIGKQEVITPQPKPKAQKKVSLKVNCEFCGSLEIPGTHCTGCSNFVVDVSKHKKQTVTKDNKSSVIPPGKVNIYNFDSVANQNTTKTTSNYTENDQLKDEGFSAKEKQKIVFIALGIVTAIALFIINFSNGRKEEKQYSSYSQDSGYFDKAKKKHQAGLENLSKLSDKELDQKIEKALSTPKPSVDFGNLRSDGYGWISENYDIESPYKETETIYEETKHYFDLKNRMVYNIYWENGKQYKSTYKIKSYYKQTGITDLTTHVFVLDDNYVKEAWFSFDMKNLGYDLHNGQRTAYYELTNWR